MSSEQNPGLPPARRRMTGYKPAVSNPHPQITGEQKAPTSVAPPVDAPTDLSADAQVRVVPGAGDGAETAGTATAGSPASGVPLQSPAAPAVTAAPARRRRMGGAPAPMAGAKPNDLQAEASATAPEAAFQTAAPTGPAAPRKVPPARKRMGGSGMVQPGTVAAPGTTMAVPVTPVSETAAPAAQTATASAPGAQTPPRTPATMSQTSTGETGKRPAWVKPAVIIAVLLVVAAALVLGARWLRTLEGVQQFIAAYDGHSSQPQGAPAGIPAWLGWQHFLNMFFIVLIIRTGLQVRAERKPPGYWTAKKGSFFSPKGNIPKKVSLTQWLHQCLDVLWVANGLIFIVLLFATGHWMRIVPADWDILPNMLSAGIQYASLDWPAENGWIHYNALQVMAYFITVFIAAPLAVLSGIRMSTWWPDTSEKLNKAYPVEWARALHFPVMLYFLGFTVVHVFLVFFTGARVNLNHMYTSRDVADWWGLVIFLISLAVIAAAWFLARPLFTTPVAARMGKVSK